MPYKYGYVEGQPSQQPVPQGADPLDRFITPGPRGGGQQPVDPLDRFIDNGGRKPGPMTVSMRGGGVAEESPGILDQVARQIGLTARAGVAGALALPNTVGDILNTGINAGIRGVNSLGANIPELTLPSQATQNLMTSAGLPVPQSGVERVAQDVASSLVGTGGQYALGKALMNVPAAAGFGKSLTVAPAAQLAGAAGSSAAAGGTREAGGGTGAQIAAGLVGGALPIAGMAGAQGVARALGASAEPPSPAAVTLQTRAKMTAPVEAQRQNIETMRAIGLESQRPSAITGDKFTAGQEYQHSKIDSPSGEVMRGQLAKEQDALKSYGNNLIKNTGAVAQSPEEAGQIIRAPLRALSDYYDSRIGDLYRTADAAAAGASGVIPENFSKLMGTSSQFAGKQETAALKRGILAYARENGIPTNGSPDASITAKQAEGMRQYLNSQWSPQNSGLIGKIKEALDLDVAKIGGDDLYAQARTLHAERKNTLDNPSGIGSLLVESGPNGINQLIPDEKVAAKISSMPVAQLRHIVTTMSTLPEAIAPQGAQALSEIKAELARRVYRAGDRGGNASGPSMWNASDVAKELNAQSGRMGAVFSPDELSGFNTLKNAGDILQTPSAYPGAAVQQYNLMQKGAIKSPGPIGALIGTYLGGVPGAVAGGAVGSLASKRVASVIDKKLAEDLARKLMSPEAAVIKK